MKSVCQAYRERSLARSQGSLCSHIAESSRGVGQEHPERVGAQVSARRVAAQCTDRWTRGMDRLRRTISRLQALAHTQRPGNTGRLARSYAAGSLPERHAPRSCISEPWAAAAAATAEWIRASAPDLSSGARRAWARQLLPLLRAHGSGVLLL